MAAGDVRGEDGRHRCGQIRARRTISPARPAPGTIPRPNRIAPPVRPSRSPTVRLYFEVARRSFRRHLAYRAATLAGLFTNAVFGVLIASVYGALYDGRGETAVAGFSRAEAM